MSLTSENLKTWKIPQLCNYLAVLLLERAGSDDPKQADIEVIEEKLILLARGVNRRCHMLRKEGVGRSSRGADTALSFKKRYNNLSANFRRVLARQANSHC